MDQSNSTELFQRFVDLLQLNEKVQVNGPGKTNIQILKEGSSLTLEVDNGNKYVFVDPNSKTNVQSQGSDKSQVVSDQFKYSLIHVFQYFYEKSVNVNNAIGGKEFIEISNHFMRVINNSRVYQSLDRIVWSEWNTYWSKPDRRSFCYSNCSGACNPLCQGAQCLYYFPKSELTNPNLPDQEKSDPNNVFDNDLFWIAGKFSEFVKQKPQEHVQVQFQGQIIQGNSKIGVKLQSGEVLEVSSLSVLYGTIERNAISALSIQKLEVGDIPNGEGERAQLYNFILSLPNLSSLEIQLEHGIYHTREDEQIDQAQQQRVMMVMPHVNPNVVNNFVKFILSLKVLSLSLILDEFCYPVNINLEPIITNLPNLNQQLRELNLSINHRRKNTAPEILANLCKMKSLQKLTLNIKTQWAMYHSTYSHIQEDFKKWEQTLKSSISTLKSITII